MPIKIQSDLPVKEILEKENIFVMDEKRASHQDIRPIQILILNAVKRRYGTSAASFFIKYSASGGCLFYDGGNP